MGMFTKFVSVTTCFSLICSGNCIFGGETWGGTGTLDDPAWYIYRETDGTGFNSTVGQTLGPFSNVVAGNSASYSQESKQKEAYSRIELQNGNLVTKNIWGSDNYLFGVDHKSGGL